jgi:tetratricopeptide (TPR) repeat protein
VTDFDAMTDHAETAVEQRRLVTAKSLYQKALSLYPEHASFISYNLGALHFWHSGNGEEARRWFREAIKHRPSNPPPGREEVFGMLESNACENLMLLSLSYDEYDEYAERLKKLQPDSDILHAQLPRVHDLRGRGLGWPSVMLWFAASYFDLEASKDPGRYGNAAATFQLMLAHRKALRVPRHDHRAAVLGYGGSSLRLVAACDLGMRRTVGSSDPTEFLFLLEDPLRVAEEYHNANPSDQEVRQLVSALEGALASGQRAPQAQSASGPAALKPPAALRWLPYLAGTVVGATLGHFVVTRAPQPWGAVVGGLVGLLAIGPALHKAFGSAWREFSQEGSQVAPKGQAHAPKPPLRQRPRECEWQTSSALIRAITESGIGGLRFELSRVTVEEGVLSLAFRALALVPTGKEHDAGLGLRCVVWLTLPSAVAAVAELNLGQADSSFTVALGPGVPVPVLMLKMGNEVSAPLQCSSDEEGEVWYVHVKPAMLTLGDFESTIQVHQSLFDKLAPAFEQMKGKTIVLAS